MLDPREETHSIGILERTQSFEEMRNRRTRIIEERRTHSSQDSHIQEVQSSLEKDC